MITKMITGAILLICLWGTPEEQDAIERYKTYGLQVTPKTLKEDTIFLVNYKDTTYHIQKDMNGIPWVSR